MRRKSVFLIWLSCRVVEVRAWSFCSSACCCWRTQTPTPTLAAASAASASAAAASVSAASAAGRLERRVHWHTYALQKTLAPHSLNGK